ncbi:MAG: NAD(P)H-dependent oxidoreductase subunit E, partial [Alphaproteobacteria bacterium]|nr:NAD(P)H-dependent oxidoreductase subunit E [Alphaproteobacteria bacterium]
VSFYHDFMETKDSRPAIALCRAEACQARGVEAVAAAALAACADRVRLETVYCLGLCSVGPAARVGDTLYARLDAVNIRNLVSTL